jgi:hypothetical protein
VHPERCTGGTFNKLLTKEILAAGIVSLWLQKTVTTPEPGEPFRIATTWIDAGTVRRHGQSPKPKDGTGDDPDL